jgi:alpha-tubulin suppressor-like RCC1 family protein
VSAGGYHACGVRTDQTLWCWGYNGYGEIGQGSTATTSYTTPQQVTGTTWASVAAGYYHTCATRTDGTLWC